MYRFALYASNHGFGHATRMAALAASLIDFGIYVFICTDRPQYLYQDLPNGKWQYRQCRIDGGVVHGKNLTADLDATKAMLLDLFAHRDDIVGRETLWLRQERIDLVISDIPFLVIEAAGYAQIPVFGISNFDWAFIYADLFKNDPQMQVVINTIYGLYRRMDRSYLPSLGTSQSVSGFRNPIECGLLARRCIKPRPETEAKTLSIMFGGEGNMDLDWQQICEAWDGLVYSTNTSCTAHNHRLMQASDDFLAQIQISDLVLCKPGYSTFAEILSAGKPMLYIPRTNYPEETVLIDGVRDYPAGKCLDQIPTSVKSWKEVFDSMPRVGKRIPEDNDAIVGRMFQDFLDVRIDNANLMSVFDLGSNNLNYCLWDTQNRKVLHRCWINTYLARNMKGNELDYTNLSNQIPALKSLLECDAQIRSRKYLIATGISRIADNAASLIRDLAEEWKLSAKIISAKEEMKYALQAASHLIPKNKQALIFDIGGTSTELVWRKAGRGFAGISLQLGLVSLAGHSEPEQAMQEALQELTCETFDVLVGVGLTATLLVSMIRNEDPEEILDQNDLKLSRDELQALAQRISEDIMNKQFSSHDELVTHRSMMMAAKFVTLLLDRFGQSDFLVCNEGISVGFARWKTL
ncbi:MAG: glycosyltransferase [Candidatus Cloacimonetes bacterium]|nr:glycosyltransferase [Candidatus Cloacimonadota bacterium]